MNRTKRPEGPITVGIPMSNTTRAEGPIMVGINDDLTTTYPGRTLEAVIAAELEGFAARRAAFLGRNPDERDYLESEDDHSLWRDRKLLAVIRAVPGGVPEVTRFGAEPAGPVARPGTRTIVATTGEHGRWKLSRVTLNLDDAIEEEVQDYRAGLIGAAERGIAADAYAAGEPDVALWEGERLLAVLRPLPGGEPEVVRFDGPRPAAGPREDAVTATRPGEGRPTAAAASEADPAARLLPWDVTDRAIVRWVEVARERDDAYRASRDGDERELEKWTDLATRAEIDAERQLIAAILAWSPEFHGVAANNPSKWPWPPRGVLHCGRLYLAIPDPEREGEEGGGEVDLMQLAVVPMSSVVDMNDAPDYVPTAGDHGTAR